jgi:hypothetical protein
MDVDMDEIEKAKKAHASIPESLKDFPVVLRKPDTQIIHTISSNSVFGGIPENWSTQDIELVLLNWRVLSGKQLAESTPLPDKTEIEFRQRWFNGGDHDLLKEIMSAGRVPLAWQESWSPNKPRTLQDALLVAKSSGYSVPDKFLAESKNTSYSEAEAFYAAYMLVSGNFMGWHEDSSIGDRWDVASRWNNRRSYICQLTGQFIVPDPLDDSKTPYFLDQLWIYATSDNQVRLIGLEIDGEIHLDEQVRKRDMRRDAMLAAKGYEIYHVAGWWCRIDPYRVVCEFLNASGILPNAQKCILGCHFDSISDYVCELCHEPMVRWDIDWIMKTELYEQELLVHRSCAEKVSEGYYS